MKQAFIPAAAQLEFRDPTRVAALRQRLQALTADLDESITVMHVCGSHEQAIARFGLRSLFPPNLHVIMGPGCPVCVTDMPEVDEAVYLAQQGVTVVTFGDMFRVPGTVKSLAEAKAEGADVRIIYSPWEVVQIAHKQEGEVVFFATGFETTAVATAALVLAGPPKNLSILSSHKYIPPIMEIVAEMPHTEIQGFLAAGHAATITGWKIFERFVARHGIPVVIAGFEPLDILSALVQLVEIIRRGEQRVANAYPRCVEPEGNRNAQRALWKVFEPFSGVWRGIAYVPNGNLRLRPQYAWVDARERFDIRVSELLAGASPRLTQECICGNIMAGIATPRDCNLYGKECTPETPVGACMVSSEGTCKIWYEYGGHVVS